MPIAALTTKKTRYQGIIDTLRGDIASGIAAILQLAPHAI